MRDQPPAKYPVVMGFYLRRKLGPIEENRRGLCQGGAEFRFRNGSFRPTLHSQRKQETRPKKTATLSVKENKAMLRTDNDIAGATKARLQHPYLGRMVAHWGLLGFLGLDGLL